MPSVSFAPFFDFAPFSKRPFSFQMIFAAKRNIKRTTTIPSRFHSCFFFFSPHFPLKTNEKKIKKKNQKRRTSFFTVGSRTNSIFSLELLDSKNTHTHTNTHSDTPQQNTHFRAQRRRHSILPHLLSSLFLSLSQLCVSPLSCRLFSPSLVKKKVFVFSPVAFFSIKGAETNHNTFKRDGTRRHHS